MAYHVFEREQVLDHPLADVFAFFGSPANLERLTPPSVHFQFRESPPAALSMGAEIRYRIRIVGVPLEWTTRITEWDPPYRFADLQARGPYAYWLHTHTFTALTQTRTLMRDRVIYRVPFGPFGEIARRVFVGWQLGRIFDYRERTVPEALRLAVT